MTTDMTVHYSSETVEWGTPQDFFDRLDGEFGFTIDVCAVPENAKCARFYSPDEDGLAQEWTGTCWLNPPYGRKIGRWIRKAYEASRAGATVVCLIPSRTDTAWFHDYVVRGEVRFVRGRLLFTRTGGETPLRDERAPFPSVVVIFRPPAANPA